MITYGSEARRIFLEEAARYGLQLDFEITPSPQTIFIWGSLKLSQRSLYNPPEYVRMIIRHKLGYRIYFPGTSEWEKVAILIAAGHGIRAPQAFAYLCADFFTALAILSELEAPCDRAVYVRAVLKDSHPVDPKPVWLLKALVFQGLFLGTLTPADAGRLRVPEEYYQAARQILDILNSSVPVVNKLDRLAEVLRPFLNECYAGVSDLSRMAEVFPVSDFESDKPLPALASLPSELINVALNGLYGRGREDEISFAEDPVVVQAARLSLYNEFLASSRRRQGQVDSGRYYGTWSIGDDPAQLLIRDTLRAFGVVAPPLFSLKWVEGERGPASSCSHVGIALDVSSSMLSPPSKAARAKEAAYGLVEEAKRRGIEVSICYFNSASLLRSYRRDYERAQADIASVIVKGGTDLAKPIAELAGAGAETMLVITDAEVTDELDQKAVLSALSRASENSDIHIFIIGDRKQDWIIRKNWRTYQIKPGENFTEKTLHIL